MKNYLVFLLILFGTSAIFSQAADSTYIKKHYDIFEYRIPMRDGIKLFTVVYVPKDKRTTYPILMNRTCYNASRFANYNFRQPSKYLVEDKYIIVFQDVRGRYMSEGTFDNMRPNVPGNDIRNQQDIDESSDTFDSIDWLLKNVAGNNGKVGMLGISYPGFYTAAALPDAHPALKASSPQAPIADFFFDDFHHNGAFLQSYTGAFPVFGYQKDTLTRESWYQDKRDRLMKDRPKDGYDFHLRQKTLKNITEKYHYDNFFWQQCVEHPNYDAFWQERNILPHLNNINHAVMTVGGWFDAEDLYGSLQVYKTIERTSPQAKNTIVMGPWAHGGWSREKGQTTHNHIYFGDSISTGYLREIERPFFAHYLKGQGSLNLPEAFMYDTGKKRWESFEKWPPSSIPSVRLSFHENGKLGINEPVKSDAVFEYISDPNKPVPYTSQIEEFSFTPRWFMTDDQRHASRRPDVLTFESEPLRQDLTLGGEIIAKLNVALSETDADFIVKLIDVYPDDHPNYAHNPENIVMAGYQQLVRAEVFRGRFRNSFEHPEPFVPNQKTGVNIVLQDMLHTFKKGHRIMIQMHSTWFPYIDRNPQKYVDNIYKAETSDFIKATVRIFGDSTIEIGEPNSVNPPLPFKK